MTKVKQPRVRLTLPPGFAGLPLGESEQDNARNLRELAERIAAPAGMDKGTMLRHLTVLATVMARNQVLLFGRFLVSATDTERPAPANLVMSVAPLAVAPTGRSAVAARNRGAAAADLLRRHRERVPRAVAHVVDLPVGPAMVAATAGDYRLPPETTGRPDPLVRPEFKAEFQILAPDGLHLIALAVTTGDETAWPAVAAAAMRVATSLRFEPAEK